MLTGGEQSGYETPVRPQSSSDHSEHDDAGGRTTASCIYGQRCEPMDPYDAFDELARDDFGDDLARARELFSRCEPLIRGVVRKICAARPWWSGHGLEDITQECLLQVLKALKNYKSRHPGQLWEFIKTIAWRTSGKRPPRQLAPLPPDDNLTVASRPRPDTDPPLDKEVLEAVEHCLERLRRERPDWYKAIVACDLRSFPEREASKALGIPRASLGDHKRKGREWLLRCLEGQGIDHFP